MDKIDVVGILFIIVLAAFGGGLRIGEIGARDRACGVCDDAHKDNVCGAYVCTQEGWR